jgi:F0F1-type ATP synthase membrane subunit b/b'
MHELNINWWDLANKEAPALGWYIITFVIFVGIIVHYVRKPLALYLEARALEIRKAIEEAKLAKEQAYERMAEYEARVAALDQEIANLKREFLARGEQEKKAFEQSAAKLAQQITKEAEENLVTEVRHALLSLKSDMADAIIARARSCLDSNKDKAAESGLKSVFNQGVSELRN